MKALPDRTELRNYARVTIATVGKSAAKFHPVTWTGTQRHNLIPSLTLYPGRNRIDLDERNDFLTNVRRKLIPAETKSMSPTQLV